MKTAVDWLVETLNNKINYIPIKHWDYLREIIQQAKAMEKEQIKMCCIKTMETCNSDMNELGCKTMDDYFNYIYNETFKSE